MKKPALYTLLLALMLLFSCGSGARHASSSKHKKPVSGKKDCGCGGHIFN